MTRSLHRARDLKVLDAVDAFPREPLKETVWRVTRAGRDPLIGAATSSRWCNATFDVLYTSFERDGAIAEIYALLTSQPVFPSRMQWFVHQLTVECAHALRLKDLTVLAPLGVDAASYRSRAYTETQAVADAAYFLGFDSLVVPSARFACANLVIFTDRVGPAALNLETTEPTPIDWEAWRKRMRAEG